MGAGALRRRLPAGARRPAAPRYVCRAGGLSAPGDEGACRGLVLALRFRARSVARLPRAEDLVHAEDLRHRKARRGDHAHLCARRISGGADSGRAAARIVGAGAAQHRLLPLSRRRRQQGQSAISSPIFRSPGSRRRRRRCSMASSRSGRRSSITAPISAISMR